jgi:DNA-binding NtrC family response regulator
MSTKGRIMLIDDEPIVCERLKPALEKVGFEVETHIDSQAAVDRLAEAKFDVVVTDVKMRGPDGLDVLHFVKQHSPSTKVVIITGFATVETARDAMKSGAVDFIAKPFKISQLRDLILNMMQGSK